MRADLRRTLAMANAFSSGIAGVTCLSMRPSPLPTARCRIAECVGDSLVAAHVRAYRRLGDTEVDSPW